VLGAAGLSAGLVHGLRIGDVAGQVPRMLGAAVAQVPAVWVLGAIAVLLTGLWPRLVALGWAALGLCFALTQVGELLGLPEWALGLSPLRHTPQLPAVSVQFGPLLVLLAVAALLTGAGLLGLRRRDID